MDYVFLCWMVVAITFVVVNCLVWFGFLLCYMVLLLLFCCLWCVVLLFARCLLLIVLLIIVLCCVVYLCLMVGLWMLVFADGL